MTANDAKFRDQLFEKDNKVVQVQNKVREDLARGELKFRQQLASSEKARRLLKEDMSRMNEKYIEFEEQLYESKMI